MATARETLQESFERNERCRETMRAFRHEAPDPFQHMWMLFVGMALLVVGGSLVVAHIERALQPSRSPESQRDSQDEPKPGEGGSSSDT